MNQLNPVKVVLYVIEEVQLFLVANTDKYRVLTETNLIRYALIKLAKTGGMHAKGIEKWHKLPA